MLLTIDVGNTATKFAFFENNQRKHFLINPKEDDYRKIILNFLYRNGLGENSVSNVIICCVVSSLKQVIVNNCKDIFNFEPILIDKHLNYGIDIIMPSVDEIGEDLIVMNVYAAYKYNVDLIIASFGTCTVLTHVDANKQLKYGIIAPGFEGFSSIIGKSTALEFTSDEFPKSFLANTTETAINVGVYGGYLGLVKHLISGLKQELNKDVAIICCGGLGGKIVPLLNDVILYEPDLVTEGLNYIFNRYYNV